MPSNLLEKSCSNRLAPELRPSCLTNKESGGESRAWLNPASPRQKFTGLRILFMDEEEMIRHLARLMLELLGCEVEVATSGEEAIHLYREGQRQERPFQAVIFDLTVDSGMGGAEALGQLRKRDPQIRAIISSGYTYDPIILAAPDHGFKCALVKPYNLEELYLAVATAFAAEANSPAQ